MKNHLEAQAKYEIQGRIKSGELHLVWSYILSYKNSVNPFPEVRYQIEGWKQYAVEEIIETPDIVQLSTRFQEMGVKSKNALHIACAVQGKCRSFITTDKGIKILVEYLGDIGTEKFLSMVRQDPFDYTLWQVDLWKDKSVGEISAAAMEYYKQNHDTTNPAT